jgi:hypothetical protein
VKDNKGREKAITVVIATDVSQYLVSSHDRNRDVRSHKEEEPVGLRCEIEYGHGMQAASDIP